MNQVKKLLTVALALCALQSNAQKSTDKSKGGGLHKAYNIKLVLPDVKDTGVYLAHFYGKGGNEIYISDSAKFKKGGIAEFHSNDSNFVGGSYMLLMSDKRTNFEFLLDRGDNLTITGSVEKLPESLKFTGSHQNDLFIDYEIKARENGEAQQKLVKELETCKTKEDTAKVREKSVAQSKKFVNYRRDVVKNNPGSLVASILNALEKPEIPEGDHFLADGKTKDSTFAYRYYKNHFWDYFNFQDDRLIYTPLYDGLLDEYFSKEVLPYPDSVEQEGDMLLKKARGSKDVFKYTLYWLTKYVENSKVMGLSDAFVYFVENYYMKGDAFWLSQGDLQKYIDRARKMGPNVIGNVAPELKLPNVGNKKTETLSQVKSKYTLVMFYSPNCGHCQHEIPALDSAYEASLKEKGLTIFTVATEGDDKAINAFLEKHKVDKKWVNTWDPENVGNYHNNYDVYSTPTIYLLDDRKIIVGKRLDHSNIGSLIDMNERKKKEKTQKK